MYKVYYEIYKNDYNRTEGIEKHWSLMSVADWLINNASKNYENGEVFFVDPDSRLPYIGDKLRLCSSCISSNPRNGTGEIWVHMIRRDDGGIIYSDGKYTNGISHWNDEVKEWLRESRKRAENRSFNFV